MAIGLLSKALVQIGSDNNLTAPKNSTVFDHCGHDKNSRFKAQGLKEL